MTREDRAGEVRERAYALWELAGRPWGREHEFWKQASDEIEGNEVEKPTPNRFVAR